MAKSLWRWTMWFAHLVSIGFFMIDDGMSLIKCGWLSARDGPKYMVCLSVPIKFISWAARKWVQASMSFATFFTVTLWIPLIHCNLTKDSIVSELSWSSNSLALSLSLFLHWKVVACFPCKSVTMHWTVCSSNMQDKMFPGLDMCRFLQTTYLHSLHSI